MEPTEQPTEPGLYFATHIDAEVRVLISCTDEADGIVIHNGVLCWKSLADYKDFAKPIDPLAEAPK